MTHVADYLHRLPQSPTAAAWAMRAAAAATIVLSARLLVLAISVPQLPLVETSAAPTTMRASPEPIASLHLFGIPSADARLAPTTLALTLRGTVDSTDPALATAIVSAPGQKEAGYHLGDTLPGGGVLDAIHADRVEILNGGQRESLALTDKRVGQETGSAAASAPLPVTATAPASDASGTGEPAATASPALAARLLATQSNVLPVIDNGRVVGVRIGVADVTLLERVGLRRDDVVTSIDGQAVADADFGKTLESRLQAGAGITLVVRRDGREQTVRIGR